MEWWASLTIIIGALFILFAIGMPVALAFFCLNVVALLLVARGSNPLGLLTIGAFDSLNSFILVAVPLFVLMGEFAFRSGLVDILLDAFDKVIGRVPGRLSLLAVGTGTALSTLSGTSIATVAMLGTSLVPEMRRRGYSKWLSLGSILGSGALAVIIPPSGLAVILASLAYVSVGRVLIGGAMPGFLIALLYTIFIITVCWLRPEVGPKYDTGLTLLKEKIVAFARALPFVLIVFLVLGLIFLGVATPSESAALGVAGVLLMAAAYRRLNLQVMKAAILSTARTSGMIFLIIAGSKTFSHVLSLTGASTGLVATVVGWTIPPIATIIVMLLLVLLMGTFIDAISIMMITVPLFFPIIINMGYDPIWFAILMLIGVELGGISPPFGLLLFALKGVAPEASMAEIYKGGIPFFLIQLVAMGILIAFPIIVLWLPGLMYR